MTIDNPQKIAEVAMYPPGYGQYQAIVRASGHTPNPMIAKFAARYRFAGQLNSIEILGASEIS